MSAMKLVTFEALDSLFFRDSKPFNAGEGGFLDSQFPPSAQTLSGAIRGAIGDAQTAWDWSDKARVARLLGTADNPFPLTFAGPYLLKNGRRLYPVPLNLLYSAAETRWARLAPSSFPRKTDMGERRLPEPQQDKTGGKLPEAAKPVATGWLDGDNMGRVLAGELPAATSCNQSGFIHADQVFAREARVGIGRDNASRTAHDGLLYFTRHVRLKPEITLGMALGGVEPPDGGMLRLGGEGRMARAIAGDMPAALPAPKVMGELQGLVLILLTHGDFDGEVEPDFNRIDSGLELVSACIGKPVREGGWDYARRAPKPLKSLVPAGSCYFVTMRNGNLAEVAAKLHGQHIGQRTAFGYGEIAVGIWK